MPFRFGFKQSATEDEEKKPGCYLVTAIGMFPAILVSYQLFPWIIPFSFFEFWRMDIGFWELMGVSWPFFLWGVVVSGLSVLLTSNSRERNLYAEHHLGFGVFSSVIAGLFEEISFRWLMFYGAMIGIVLTDFLFFGWLGFGIEHWFYVTISAPLANFFTLGYLQPQLIGEYPWWIGAAMILSNGKFRDGHGYQGLLGWINSWFMGMFFYYLMFNYGLFAAIIVHFLYDFFIDIVVYADAVIERTYQ